MLRFLRIRRLAVIHSAEVEFGPGLNVLTGETGAGKSILVEAVALLLGGRAYGDLVRTGEETAIIEAVFESGGEDLLIRREITAQGRSRALINGELTTVGALKALSSSLVELHGQHEHQTLLDPTTHLATLDAYGNLDDRRAVVGAAFARWQNCQVQLHRARQSAAERSSRHELIAFQAGELERAVLTPGEDDELAASRRILLNAERVSRLCQESYQLLYEGDGAVLGALAGIWRRVGELAVLDSEFEEFLRSRDDIKSQLEDLSSFLRRYADSIDASPATLQQVEDRLTLLERLKKKYGPTLADVISRRDDLLQEMDGADRGASQVVELERAHDAARGDFLVAASGLSDARRRLAGEFARRLEAGVAALAMDQTRFEVRLSDRLPEPSWTASGIDEAEFFVSPNPGEDLKPLTRIASGGELSRIMLAIKTLLLASRRGAPDSAHAGLSATAPGLVFDEVDAGIGGRVADAVGRTLQVLGSAFQVLCITHLPQIAAYADSHFQIEKMVADGRTTTTVSRLGEAGRVDELSRMLGGSGSSVAIRASARALLADRRGMAKGEMPTKGESESPFARPPAGAPTKGRRGSQ